MIFDVSGYLAEEASLLPRPYLIEDIGFEFLALTDDLIQSVKKCETYNDMIELAADSGLAYYDHGESFRVVDNDRMLSSVSGLWEKSELDIDTDPSIRHKAGILVCEISGISGFVLDKKEYEKIEKEEADARAVEAKKHLADEGKENVINGDNLPDMTTELGNLDPSQLAKDAINNAA